MMTDQKNVDNMETILIQQGRILNLLNDALDREANLNEMLGTCMRAILDLQDRVTRLEEKS